MKLPIILCNVSTLPIILYNSHKLPIIIYKYVNLIIIVVSDTLYAIYYIMEEICVYDSVLTDLTQDFQISVMIMYQLIDLWEHCESKSSILHICIGAIHLLHHSSQLAADVLTPMPDATLK